MCKNKDSARGTTGGAGGHTESSNRNSATSASAASQGSHKGGFQRKMTGEDY